MINLEKMTISLWVSILVAIIAGLFGGLVGPLIDHGLLRRRWRSQKTFELKYDTFRGAVEALAAWAADAVDFDLQRNKPEYQGTIHKTHLRPSTEQAVEHHKGLVEAMFSPRVISAFDAVLRSHISIENVPNTEFEEKRSAFVVAAASELGLFIPGQ